jgi:uncharacterized protein YrrD
MDGGATIAHVEDMMVDPSRRQVLALVVQEKSLGKPTRAIPFGRVSANGADAVLVPNAKVSLEVDRDPVLRGLDNAHKVVGTDVMTDTGRKVGKMADMLIDDHTGEIKSYELVVGPGEEKQSVPAEAVTSIGKDYLYVTAASVESLDNKPTRVIVVPDSVKEASAQPIADDETPAATAVDQAPALPFSTGMPNLDNMLGGTNVNTRLLFGILIIVLGILVLVSPSLLPLVVGISLIVLGLWIALQNATTGTRP